MKRVAIATAWVWVALAQPASAHARPPLSVERAAQRGAMPEMCAITPSPALSSPAVPSAAVPSARVDNARNDFARGDFARNDFVREDFARELTPQAPLDDNPIAWCSTPDDPRCSSRDASSLPGSGYGQVPLNSACGVTPPAPRVREVARVSKALQLGAARDGQALRVERPPRASLRRG